MSLYDVIDTALDRSVALGYGNLGFELRRRLPGWPADPPRLEGKTAVVTGAGSGLGLSTAQRLAELGARVAVIGRNQARADEAAALVLEAVPGAAVEPWPCDVSSLEEMRSFASSFIAVHDRLDVLINNAGVMPDERTRSADGVELMFATHVLAPFALTWLFSDLLKASAPSRVISVSSGGMYGQRLPADDLESERTSYGPKKLYARTKREEVALTEAWAARLADDGVVVHAMHPGWVDTKGVRQWLPVFRKLTRPIIRSPDQGADTIVWLAGAPQALETTGRFWADRRPRPTHYALGAADHTRAQAEQVWERCRLLLESGGHGDVRAAA